MVGAGITICLDLLQRNKSDLQAQENRRVLEVALSLLRANDDSVLATQGAHLIAALSNGDWARLRQPNSNPSDNSAVSWPVEPQNDNGIIWQKDMSSFEDIEKITTHLGVQADGSDKEPNLPSSAAIQDDFLSWIDMMTDNFPLESGFDTLKMFEHLIQ